jgi:hypothetical protein
MAVDVFLTLACIHYFFWFVVVIFLNLMLTYSPCIGFVFVLISLVVQVHIIPLVIRKEG